MQYQRKKMNKIFVAHTKSLKRKKVKHGHGNGLWINDFISLILKIIRTQITLGSNIKYIIVTKKLTNIKYTYQLPIEKHKF